MQQCKLVIVYYNLVFESYLDNIGHNVAKNKKFEKIILEIFEKNKDILYNAMQNNNKSIVKYILKIGIIGYIKFNPAS